MMMMSFVRASLLLIVALLTTSRECQAFRTTTNLPVSTRTIDHAQRRILSSSSPSALYLKIPFLGRNRQKKEFEQESMITIGSSLPEGVDVEMLTPTTTAVEQDGKAVERVESKILSIQEALGGGTGTRILVGMPGAFTDTCSKEHLPGFLSKLPQFTKYGVEQIAVVTTNDRFVNEAWGQSFDLFDHNKSGNNDDAASASSSSLPPVTLLCDGDGDLVKSLGLAEDQGFGLGVRAKRFALVMQDGKVQHVLTDDGMNDCSNTSAAFVLKLVAPPDAVLEESDGSFEGTLGAAVAVFGLGILLLAFLSQGGDAGSGGGGGGGAGSFNLLKDFL